MSLLRLDFISLKAIRIYRHKRVSWLGGVLSIYGILLSLRMSFAILPPLDDLQTKGQYRQHHGRENNRVSTPHSSPYEQPSSRCP